MNSYCEYKMFRLAHIFLCFFIFFFSLPAEKAISGPIDEMLPGHWYEVPNSNLSRVFPNPLPPGVTGPQSVMEAWSGGAYDTKRDRLLIWGGGHADYAGNEIYAFDINTLSWSRIWGPTPNSQIHDGSTCLPSYSDGSASSRHTYGGVVYLPDPIDAMFANGGSLWCNSGGGMSDTWLFNFSSNSWQRKSDGPQRMDPSLSASYDPSTGHVFLRNTNAIAEFNPGDNTWITRSNREYWGDQFNITSAIDPTRRILVFIGQEYNNGTKLGVFHLSSFSFSIPPYSGDTEILNANAPGLSYDSQTNRMVAWDGGQYAFVINLDTWVITKISPASTNTVTPSPSAPRGTYGRWQYIPSRNVFIGVNSTNENVYFYKLSSGTPNAAPNPPTGLRLAP